MIHYRLPRSPVNWLAIIFFAVILIVIISFFPTPVLFVCVSLLVVGLFAFYYGRLTLVALVIVTSILLAYRLPLPVANITPFRGVVFLGVFFLAADIFFHSNPLRLQVNHKLISFLFFVFPLGSIFIIGVLRNINDPQAIFKGLSFGLAIISTLLIAYFLTNRKDFIRIVKLQIVTSILLSIYGLYEFSLTLLTGTRPKLPFAQFGFENIVDKSSTAFESTLELLRVESFLNDSNILAVFLTCSLLFCLAFIGEQKTRASRFLLGVIIALLSICIILTLSRSGIVGLCFGLAFILLKAQKGKLRVWRKLITVGVIVSIILAGFYFLNQTFADYVQGFIYRFSIITNEDRRIGLILEGFNTFFDHPLIGVGVGNLTQDGQEITTFHSSYLTILTELGVLGGISLVFFFTPVLMMIWKTFASSRTQPLEVGIASSTVAIMVFEMFYDTLFLSPTTIIVWGIAYGFSLLRVKL